MLSGFWPGAANSSSNLQECDFDTQESWEVARGGMKSGSDGILAELSFLGNLGELDVFQYFWAGSLCMLMIRIRFSLLKRENSRQVEVTAMSNS